MKEKLFDGSNNNQNQDVWNLKSRLEQSGENTYREVNTKEYVEAGLENGSLTAFEAEKFARISAIRGKLGQEVISWSEDPDTGAPIKERVGVVELDEETGEAGWIVTKTNDAGEPIIDRNGNKNEWIIGDAKFKQKYEADPEHPGVFRPTGGKQKFVKTSENLVISQWGDEMRMPKGSYINITNPEDMYAINPRDFEDTYRALPKDESENSEN
ncbi:hypothetical protein IKF15_01035 [Candidatus Saccharibacteria bacterium]|nr:hypothetical protein [Candidatus Saccharibacteria bacterium]